MDNNQKFWNRNAKFYTRIQEKGNRELYRKVMPMCAAYITPDTRVLELACGTGQFTLPLCQKAKSWEATDFSPNMIEQAQKRNIPGVNFSVQDATNLPYEDQSFDLILLANALHVVPEPEKILSEVRRVLKPDGVFLVPTFVYEEPYNHFRLWFMERAGFRSFSKFTSASLAEFLEANGFSILEQTLLPCMPVPESFAAARKL